MIPDVNGAVSGEAFAEIARMHQSLDSQCELVDIAVDEESGVAVDNRLSDASLLDTDHRRAARHAFEGNQSEGLHQGKKDHHSCLIVKSDKMFIRYLFVDLEVDLLFPGEVCQLIMDSRLSASSYEDEGGATFRRNE